MNQPDQSSGDRLRLALIDDLLHSGGYTVEIRAHVRRWLEYGVRRRYPSHDSGDDPRLNLIDGVLWEGGYPESTRHRVRAILERRAAPEPRRRGRRKRRADVIPFPGVR